jgi:hypothetical protein
MLSKEHRDLLKECITHLEEVQSALDVIKSELQTDFDDLSDAAQQGDKGAELSAIIEMLEAAYDETQQVADGCHPLAHPEPTKRSKS